MSDLKSGSAYVELEPKLAKGFGDKIEAGLAPTLSRIGSKMESVGKSMSKAVTLPLLAIGTVGVMEAQKVQSGLREVVSLFGVTGAEGDKLFRELQGSVAGLSRELGIAQEVLVGGLYQAISAGVPKENAFEFLRVASKAAIAGVTNTETAVDGITSTINAFGLETNQAEAVADSMFAAVKGGKTTFDQLSNSLFQVAPAAAAMKIPFTEVNAALATMTSAGVPTSVAATQIKAALAGLARPSEELDKIFTKLGYKNAQAAIEAKGFGFALDAVKDASGGSAGELQKLLGSQEAVSAANIIAGTGAEKFAQEMENQANSAGAMNTAFEEIDKSRSIEKMKISLQNFAIAIGNVLIPVVDEVTKMLTPWIEKFQNLSPETQGLIVKIGLFAAALGPVLTIGGRLLKMTSAVIKAFKWLGSEAVISKVKVVASWVAKAAAALFHGAVIVAQLVAQGVKWIALKTIALVQAAPGVVAAFAMMAASAVAQGAVLLAQFALQIGRWALLAAAALAGAASVALAWLISMGPIILVGAAVVALVALIVKNWDTIKTAITNAARAVIDWIKANWPLLLAILTGPIGLAVLAITRNWDKIKSGVASVYTSVREWFGKVVGFVQEMPGKIKTAASGMWDGVKDAFRAAINWIIDKWNGLKFTLPEADLGPLGKVGGFTLSTYPKIPRFAKGGTFRGLAIAGEEGAELLAQGSTSRVFPHRDLAASLERALTNVGGVGAGKYEKHYHLAENATFANSELDVFAQFDELESLAGALG